MNCLNFALLLDEHLDGRLGEDAEAQCRAHLERCAACRTRREEGLQLLQALRELPAPAPDPDFPERVFAAAGSQRAPVAARRTNRAAWPGALAAGLLLAIGVLSWRSAPMPEVQAGAAEPLRLVFRSDSALQGVTIELQLPAGLELAGYPGERRLVWTSDLRAGENLLELPVRAAGDGGVLTATLNHGSERRAFSVRVVAAEAAQPLTDAGHRPGSPQYARLAGSTGGRRHG